MRASLLRIRRHIGLSMLALLLAGGCAADAVLYRAQVSPAALENARTKLKQSGDPAKILRPVTAHELLGLQSGKPHKMVVLGDGKLAISPAPDAPGNPWSHVVLADGVPVRSAGHVVVEHSARNITGITLDQESHAYCPTLDSLDAARAALRHLGVPANRIRIRNHPPGCSPVTR
jgi:hypothetical protein